jgi:hypothetical protein
MSLVTKLCAFGLRQVIGEAADLTVDSSSSA